MSGEQGRKFGWQQQPRPILQQPPKCPHIGLLFASVGVALHDPGHEWVCGCGQVFVVVSDGGQNKRLVPDWRDRSAQTGPQS
ncbi:hypothetical protein [Nocardioides sp. YIM 152315]|uniref:hypothetical protein n=1 Tax=Nocardioides sp. YIM 152315 TaxID=3031760 RepID=UPI0023DCD6E9|nr:hypothetical protein [Nocardioides sp. YIM 152315]MDF1603362.1 hypothetical protein [Nocardioides sp. YIM 152315]